jgi:hypothetical protein
VFAADKKENTIHKLFAQGKLNKNLRAIKVAINTLMVNLNLDIALKTLKT